MTSKGQPILPIVELDNGFDLELQSKTRRSVGWMFGETVLEQVFSFLIFVLMARVLEPAELGTFAIVFVLMDMGRAAARAGVFQRIAREKQLTPLKLDTIFWINVAIGIVFAIGMVAFAHLTQDFFHAARLKEVTQVMAIALVLSSIGNTHMALRLREFGHRTMAVRSLIAGVIGAAIAVGGVIAGFGIWAFVAQRIAREAIVTIFAWLSVSWRPGFSFDRLEARDDLRFGREIVAAQLVGYLSLRAQDLIIARFLGPIVLSTYRVAWRSAELLGPQLVSVFSIVSLQTFSTLNDDPAGLRSAYRSMLRNCCLLTVPALAGYGASGPWLVPALFGPQWHQAGQLAMVLSFLAIPFAMTYFFQTVMIAAGQQKWQRQIAVADLISAVVVGIATVRFGLMAVAVAYVVRAYCWIPVEILLIRRFAHIGFRDHLWALWPSVVAAVAMALVVLSMFVSLNPTNLIQIAALCLAGALIYAAIVALLLPAERSFLMAKLKRQR